MIGLKEPSQRLAIRIGAVAATLVCIGYLVIIPLYWAVGAPPHDGEAWFRYLPGRTAQWWAILWISVATDLLYVPVALTLYQVLGRFNRPLMILSNALFGLFVTLDLAITWTHYGTILELYRLCDQAPESVNRAAFVSGANYALAMLNSPLEIVYSIVLLSAGILVAGWVMLRAKVQLAAAWLAIITGVLGLLSLSGLGLFIMGNALAATAWLLFLGIWLSRLSRA